MKNLLFSAFALFTITAFAQNQIRVEYEMIPYFDPGDKSMGMMNMVFLNSNYELIVEDNISTFKFLDKIINQQPQEGTISIQMGNRGTVFKNTTENTYLEEAALGPKNYLIQDSLTVFNWEISKESKNILGFETRKATVTLDDKHKTKITAWYAPKLNFKTGPDKFWGLPGLILELNSGFKYENGGNEGFTYKALSVEVLQENVPVTKPDKGQKVSRQNYKKLTEEFSKKRKEMYSNGVDKD